MGTQAFMASEFLAAARSAWDTALSLFYPDACQVCGKERATAREGYVCPKCWQNLRFIRPPFCERCGLPFEGAITTSFECANCRDMELHFVRARSVIAAKGMALELIHRYKYGRALWFEPLFASLLIGPAAPLLRQEGWDLIVPVPLHPMKQAEREFNQAERLARRLGRATEIPISTKLVRRVEPTRSQTRLSRAERAQNVHRAFAPVDRARCGARRIVLIDDVLTTGATTSACAKVLKDCGAGEVCVWTLARGLLH
jgi:competence protein ComFC